MRIGVTVPLSGDDTADGHAPTFAETAAFASRAERLGLDSVWVFDHLLFRFPPEPDEGVREAWTTLSGLAVAVPRVELGALVMCSSFRNPGLMAKMAATLDDLSDGRLILGLGSGWHDPEYEAFGYATDHKVGRFEEDLEVTVRLLRGERVDLDGRWRTTRGALLLPPPERRLPVLVASKGERMMRATARWADAWNTAWFGRVDERLRSRLAALEAACEAEDRDPDSLRRTIGIRLHEPGRLEEDPSGTDAEGAELAALFDELDSLGFADAVVWSISKSTAALDRLADARERHLGARAG